MNLVNLAPATCHDARDRALEVDRHLGPVRRVAVFRALGLGDLLCATPALRALRQRFPDARITLISLPWAKDLAERLPSVDDFIVFPGHPLLPECSPDAAAWPAFIGEVRAAQFDLLVQLHGSGRITNPMVSTFGARHIAAFHEPDRPAPEPMLAMPWPVKGTEAHRLMKLVDALGEPPMTQTRSLFGEDRWRIDFPLHPHDHAAAQALLAANGCTPEERYVCIHAGSQLPSRRWPLQRFIEVAKALAEQRHVLVLTGVESERPLGAALQAALPGLCINLIGQTSLWSLGALISHARLLVCNDTGVSHVAAALGTPSVVVSCGADVARWAPEDHALHPVLWADEPCRPCSYVSCPYDHACAWEVGTASVLDAAQTLLAARA